jgi:hypothetical protein
MAKRRFYVGLDLGQSHDFTAIAVVERAESQGEWDAAAFAYRRKLALRLRYLERIALGTTYPEVVSRVAEVTRSGELDGCCELVVDATGVGRPVVDMLRRAGLNCTLSPAIITGGVTESYAKSYFHVPKRDLITGLQIALQGGTLQIAAGMEHGPALIAELAEMQVRITPAGNEQFGSWREGSHDDLVFAVALSCWGARKAYPFDLGGAQKYWSGVR